uniref:Tubulin--tyrosine ligase-like protein 5 n=1 Tax=Callorhinchus milii TaxID=7868 RepID=A0A4W3IF52_CALMI
MEAFMYVMSLVLHRTMICISTELYGFDVLVDSSMKPWLLEVNLSPSLACDAPLDLKIKASMLSDMFTLVGFVCHNPMARHVKSMKTSFNFPTRSQAHRVPQRPMSASTMEPNSKAAPGKETAGGVQAPSCLGLTLEQVRLGALLCQVMRRIVFSQVTLLHCVHVPPHVHSLASGV